MERLTYRDAKGEAWYSDKGTEADRLHFIADIEDIMGDECNLSLLIKLVTAYKEGRYIIMRYAEQKGVARLLELSEADRDGRCGVFAKPGQEVWVVERDEIGKPDCVSGFVFMAEVGGFAIVHPFLGECGDIDEILNHCEEETARNYSCDVSVFPVADCYESYEAAEEALKGGEQNE